MGAQGEELLELILLAHLALTHSVGAGVGVSAEAEVVDAVGGGEVGGVVRVVEADAGAAGRGAGVTRLRGGGEEGEGETEDEEEQARWASDGAGSAWRRHDGEEVRGRE